jgi:hypothetical protein
MPDPPHEVREPGRAGSAGPGTPRARRGQAAVWNSASSDFPCACAPHPGSSPEPPFRLSPRGWWRGCDDPRARDGLSQESTSADLHRKLDEPATSAARAHANRAPPVTTTVMIAIDQSASREPGERDQDDEQYPRLKTDERVDRASHIRLGVCPLIASTCDVLTCFDIHLWYGSFQLEHAPDRNGMSFVACGGTDPSAILELGIVLLSRRICRRKRPTAPTKAASAAHVCASVLSA